MKRVLRVQINNKAQKDLILSLIKTKQQLRNLLIILWNKLAAPYRNYILDYRVMRKLLSKKANMLDATGMKATDLKDFIENSGDQDAKNFFEEIMGYNIYSNKIVVDIIDELHTNIDVAFKNFKFKNTKAFSFKPTKLRNIFRGSITLNSNIVHFNDKTRLFYATIFSKIANKHKIAFKMHCNNPKINSTTICDVKLCFDNDDYRAMITYDVPNSTFAPVLEHKYSSIDPGVNNHLSVFTQDAPSLLISFESIRRVNRECYIIIPKLSSEKTKKNKFTIRFLRSKRERTVNNELHKIANRLIEFYKKSGVTDVIFGKNKDFKTKCNIGANNNKRLYFEFPHAKFINILTYRFEEEGINLEIQEESYTSKCSCLNDDVWKYIYGNTTAKPNRLNGVRGVTRNGKNISSLFKDKILNQIFHADINGAVNILQKFLKKHIQITRWQLSNPLRISSEFSFQALTSRI